MAITTQIKIKCPACGNQLRVKSSAAGKSLSCPADGCSETLIIPNTMSKPASKQRDHRWSLAIERLTDQIRKGKQHPKAFAIHDAVTYALKTVLCDVFDETFAVAAAKDADISLRELKAYADAIDDKKLMRLCFLTTMAYGISVSNIFFRWAAESLMRRYSSTDRWCQDRRREYLGLVNADEFKPDANIAISFFQISINAELGPDQACFLR